MPCCVGRRRQTLDTECIVAAALVVITAILIFAHEPAYLIACCATGFLVAAVGAVAGSRQVQALSVIATVGCLTQAVLSVIVSMLTVRDAVNNVEDENACRQFGLLCGRNVAGVLTFLKVLLTILTAALFFRFTTSHLKDCGTKNGSHHLITAQYSNKKFIAPTYATSNGGPTAALISSPVREIISTTRI